MIVERSATLSSANVNDASVTIATFAFEKGGTLGVFAEATPQENAGDVWVLMCPKQELSLPLTFSNVVEDTCEDIIVDDYVATRGCRAVKFNASSGGDNRSEATLTATSRSIHRVVMAICGVSARTRVEGKFIMLNPGGNHVGYDYAPSADVFMAFIVTWSIVFGATSHVLWRRRDKATWLHLLLLTQLITRISWLISANRFWANAEATGEGIPLLESNLDAPTGASEETSAFIALLSLNQSTFFCTWLMITYGWLITRRWLTTFEVASCLTMYFGLFAANFVCRSTSAAYMFIGFYLLTPGLFAMCLNNCTTNLKSLRLQEIMLSNSRNPQDGAIVDSKVRIFRRSQLLVFWYIAMKITSSLVELFLKEHMWARYAIGEIIDFLANAALTFSLLPKTHSNPFNTHFIRDWEAMFEGTVNSIADRIASLGLSASEIPPPEFYVAHVGRSRSSDDCVVDICEDAQVENQGVGCFHLILVEHPSVPEKVLQHLSIAVPESEIEGNATETRSET